MITDGQPPAGTDAAALPRTDRRARRRQETIEEILDIAVEVMTAVGVNGLSLAEVTRRLGVQPPSLYKYFPSLMALYDALFLRGQLAHFEAMRDAVAAAEPGLAALTAALEASARWSLANRALAQLIFWRPVPSFEPSTEAFAPSLEMVALPTAALTDAVAAGELGAAADSDEALYIVSIISAGLLTQALANEPDLAWGEGRYTPTFPKLMQLFAAGYPPPSAGPKGSGRTR